MGQGAEAMEIVARVDFHSLDDFEAGFYDRVGDGALFVARHHIVTPSQEVPVGTRVRLLISLPTGAKALRIAGTVAWSYPRDHVPPGREAGLGVLVDAPDGDDAERIARMRSKPGAGARVRSPGARLLASAMRLPRSGAPFASLAGSVTTPPPAASPSPPAPPPQPTQPTRTSVPASSHPPAPAPRLMGLLVDQTVDPTPPPQPFVSAFESEPPRALPLPPKSGEFVPPPIAALPDAPAHQPAGAFDERRTDVDLLQSLASVDLLAVDADDVRSRLPAPPKSPPSHAPAQLTQRASFEPVGARAASDAGPRPAPEADPTGSFKFEELPSAEAELVVEANPALLEETLGGDVGEPVTAEADSVESAVSSRDWEVRTEHGVSDASTAEASTPSDGERSAISVIPRAVPPPEPWPPLPPLDTSPMGTSFLFSGRRAQEVSLVDEFCWPLGATKRIGKLDLHHDTQDAAPPPIDAPRGNPALEEPTVDGFERGATDPHLSVGGVLARVEQALEKAARDADEVPPPPLADETADGEEADSVFSSSATVRPAMTAPQRSAVDADGATRDDLKRRGAAFEDDDADTDLDLVRPSAGGRLSRR